MWKLDCGVETRSAGAKREEPHRLDRPARAQRGRIPVVTGQIDTTTPADRFVFQLMASLAQMEGELTAERTGAGLDAPRAAGRQRVMTESKVAAARQLLSQGPPAVDVARDLGVSLPTLYRGFPQPLASGGATGRARIRLTREGYCFWATFGGAPTGRSQGHGRPVGSGAESD